MNVVEEIEAIAASMSLHGLTLVEVIRQDVRLRLRREPPPAAPSGSADVLPFAANGEGKRTSEVRCPAAGVFHDREAGSPVPLVGAGSRVDPQTIVGLVREGNGTVDEVLAECSGTVARVLAADGAAVKVGDVLVECEGES